jgi:hypothetical protein
MGFGNMLKQAEKSGSSSGGARMPNVFMTLKEGNRTFRFLPDVSNPGQPIQGEIVLSVWIPVKLNGVATERRVFLNNETRRLINDRDNRLFPDEKDKSRLGPKIKRRFLMNVYDRTRVVKMEDGTIIYPTLQNEYWKKEGERAVQLPKTNAVENGSIMVLEGSVSVGSSKGLLNQIDDLSNTLYNEDDSTKLIPITDIDVVLAIRGTGWETTYSVRPGLNREPLPKQALALPLYDLKTFSTPWDSKAVEALLDGADYADTFKQYNLQMMPQLMAVPTADDDDIFG